jgi:hypothetical protein
MSHPDEIAEQLLRVLDRLALVLNERNISYALIGGLGVALRGPIRTTRDIDLLVKLPQVQLPGVLDTLVEAGFQLDVSQAIVLWNRDHLLDFSLGAIRIDWLKPVLPAFEQILSRAQWETIGERQIRVADAEGLLLLKLIAFRARDQEDIKGILAANPGSLDLGWVRREWAQLAGDGDPKTEMFEQFITEYYDASAPNGADAP